MYRLIAEIIDRRLKPVADSDLCTVFEINCKTCITIGWSELDPFMWATLIDYLDNLELDNSDQQAFLFC